MANAEETPVGSKGASRWLRWLPGQGPLGQRALWLVLLTAISAAAGLVVSPGLSAQKIPELKAADLGRPFRAPTPAGLKAGRDYDVVDEAETLRLREKARAQLKPVFDYDAQVQSSVTRTVQDGFGLMREVVAQHEAERKRPAEEELAPKKKGSEAPGAAAAKEEAALAQLLAEARKGFEQEVLSVDDDDFVALGKARFSREVENAVATLIEVGYRGRLVSSRDELSRVDALGITVRTLRGSGEYDLATAPPAIMDVREAQGELDRFASVPGNLLPEASQSLRRAVLRLAKRQLRANLTVNLAETEARRRTAYEAVKRTVLKIKKGQKVIGDGDLIDEQALLKVNAMRAQADELDVVQLQLGGALVVALVIGGLWGFFRSSFRRFVVTLKDALVMGLLAVLQLLALSVWLNVAEAIHDRYPGLPTEALLYAFPIAAGAMLVRFVMSSEHALFFAVALTCLAGILVGNSLAFAVVTLVSSLVAAHRVARAKDRAAIFRAGGFTGLAAAAVVAALGLAEGKGITGELALASLFAGFGATLAVPMVVLTLTPLVEAAFGYASDLKLLELANLNHPALKELVLQAPGTYHHSIIMGSLVEGASEAIGANPLLARACAYYHDIGKGRNPPYFGENQKGENAHDALAPAMSAVIIKRHVTDGLDMAREYKLPRLVADAIPQHHGTRLVGFFFHKAQKENEGREAPQPIDEALYRYPGPKPQFREAALVMLADAAEAASRSLTEPTTPKLEQLVQKLVNLIYSEGQLDECELTLKDLALVSQSFARTLEGIYHARPAYPPAAMGSGKPGESKPLLSLAKAPGDGRR